MDFYNVIENRTSIKKFKNNPISEDKMSRMINAAMMSPSWKNNTSYKFIIVDNPRIKDKIADAVRNNTDETAESVRTAPVVAVITANPQLSGIVEDKRYYLVDSAIAMEHFILAASNEGYGTCWIGAFDENAIKHELNIPNEYRIVGITPVGEIAENKDHYDKKEVTDYVFTNTWNKPYTDENLH